jgi:hypothetical protein
VYFIANTWPVNLGTSEREIRVRPGRTGSGVDQAHLFGHPGVISYERESMELPMAVFAVALVLLPLLALAGTDFLISNISSDELSNMGVDTKH